jgi:hypothetical protein
MATKNVYIQVPVEFDDNVTDGEALAYALDVLIETALCQTPMEEYGNPTFGTSEIV